MRKSFAIFANGLLTRKERKIRELFDTLLPHGSIPGLDNRNLVRASAPVTKIQQIAYGINAAPSKDQQEELGQLKELPRRWLAALRAVVETEAIERGRMSWEVCAPMITAIVQPFGCEVSTAKR